MDPAHRGPSPELVRALKAWPGVHYWSPKEGPGSLVLIRATAPPPRERWWLHALLFVLTFVTVAASGTLLSGGAPPPPLPSFAYEWETVVRITRGWFQAVQPGVMFAMAFMAILLVHESGHYFVARRYAINASPPFFLPAPYQINFIGTFGAFIRLRSPVADRRQLMDVGAAGPWAGFVIAMIFLVVGMMRSTPTGGPEAALVVPIFGVPHELGDALVTKWLRELLFGEVAVIPHPLALAGWFGVFVTSLNLLPLGQLDGGHILYALIGKKQGAIGVLIWLALLPLGKLFWGWWVWAALILLLSRGRVVHPSVIDRHRSVPVGRQLLGWASVALFIVTFVPVPL